LGDVRSITDYQKPLEGYTELTVEQMDGLPDHYYGMQGQRAIRRPASNAPKLGRVLQSHHPARR